MTYNVDFFAISRDVIFVDIDVDVVIVVFIVVFVVVVVVIALWSKMEKNTDKIAI